jgi:hypothetical protein
LNDAAIKTADPGIGLLTFDTFQSEETKTYCGVVEFSLIEVKVGGTAASGDPPIKFSDSCPDKKLCKSIDVVDTLFKAKVITFKI